MELFRQNTKIDFMAQRKYAAILSSLLFFLSLLSLGLYGLQWGLDFTGGTQIQLSYAQEADITNIHDRLLGAGFKEATVVSYGTSKDVLVTLVPQSSLDKEIVSTGQNETNAIVKKVLDALPGGKLEQVNFIGPQVGGEMANKGMIAVIIALLGTMIYIALRFDMRFAIGSTIALIHDPILILGIFSYFQIEFNLITLAAVLTVIGYSVNDTIVIFDRVRENFRKFHKAEALTVMNESINQTLSRTIMTSVLTLVVVFALFLMGGSLLHGFALALIIGIIVGTYSSIYVAGSLTIALGLTRQHLIPVTKEIDELP